MKCPKCQCEIPEDSNFCNKCGHNLRSPEQAFSIDLNQPQSYTPKFLADKILTTRSAMEGERKRVTVLFADVAGFTSISEKLDPEEVHQIMNGCFKILMDEIHNHQGTVNQFTGDGVMALFGAPLAIENHAQNACQAALAIQNAINDYSKELTKQFGLDFRMRLGLNSGPVIVGSIGDDLRMDYTAIGDTTNLAARMQSIAAPGTILVSPFTYQRASQQFNFRSLGRLEVKGKKDPIEVYELIKAKTDRPRLGFERKIFSEMLGRDEELNTLELQVMKTIKGEGSVVNIIGEAGIGKSRLIAELRNSDVIKRITLLEGRALSIGRNLSFHPIIDLLKHWAGISEDDSEVIALGKMETAIKSVSQEEAYEIIPFVATLMGMKLSGRYAERVKNIEGEALEKLILKNVKTLLKEAAELTPMVIVMEDLHWADDSSIEMLEMVFRLAETQRILFINVFRPGHRETGERITQRIKEKLPVFYVEIRLQPLNEQMSEALIDNMLNIKGLSFDIKNKIVQRAGGNPFFIEEVVRSFLDEGAVIVKNGTLEITDKIKTLVIPYTINDVLMDRIDRLEEDARNLVKIASVIGKNFFHRILSEMATAIDDIDFRISQLKDLQIIGERKRKEEIEYFFNHALVQEAAYDSILHQKQKEIHLQVATSIEQIFKERLHEFYGMLAYHFSRAEHYKNAEYYLVKAGEQAIRSSASIEALNYYQEGLKLYLEHGGDIKDSAKLAMFEKNIAITLHNKFRWTEAVEHIDKFFECLNLPTNPNRVLSLAIFLKNTILMMMGFDRLMKKWKPPPSEIDNDIFDLLYKKGSALLHIDNLRMFFVTISGANRISKINARSNRAADLLMGFGGIFSSAGTSYKLSHKYIEKGKAVMDFDNIQNRITYSLNSTALYHFSGNWGKIDSLEDDVIDDALKMGDLFNTVVYLWMFSFIKLEKGEFSDCEYAISRLNEIADLYESDYAIQEAFLLKAYLNLSKKRFFNAKLDADQGLKYARKRGSDSHQIMFLSYKAEACFFLSDMRAAEESMLEAKKIADQKKRLIFPYLAPYLVTQYEIDIQLLEKALMAEDEAHAYKMKKTAHKAGKNALKKLKKCAPYNTRILRLTGTFYWLTGKQSRAFKWWNKAIKKGEELCAWPDLSRAYFEIGKTLLNPKCKYKEWNGATAEGYLEKARTLFEELDLQYDLDELDKVMTTL